MSFRNSLILLGAALTTGTLGCNAFDESLIPTATAPSGLAEDCVGGDIPHYDSLNDFRSIDTSSLRNDRYQLSCVGNAQGNDGFFSVDMTAGKKWHFHVKVTPGTTADPAVYVLDSACQDSVCQRGWGLNECVEGQDEHFSFFPKESGRYYIGVDTMSSGGEPLQVLAVQPDCGNGQKEHSESCDDGNLEPGDGCDDLCRSELGQSAIGEVEPNDEPLANANVLLLDGEPLSVSGQLGSKCDFDSFAVQVPDGGSVRASLTGDCSLALRMQLINRDGLTPLGTTETDEGECPIIDGTESFASDLSEGTYFIRVTTQVENEPEALDYSIEIDALAP